MKHLRFATLLMAFVALTLVGYAQQEGRPGQGGTQNASTINYTVGDLERMDKLELTTIYIAKITRLQNILPFIPFATLEPQNPNDLRIPSTSANEKALKQLKNDRESYNQTIESSLGGLVPYSDKNKLIGAILFVQSFINKVELIGLGMDNLGY
jgi:hypothetical protein